MGLPVMGVGAILLCSTVGLVSALHGQQAGGLRAPQGGPGGVLGDLPEKLAGRNDPVGALAAQELIQVIANSDTVEETRRKIYLDFLLERLDASGLGSRFADLVSAERIVTALGTWIDARGPPFIGVREVLLPLIGLGAEHFRDAVIRSLRVLAAHEGGTVESSTTLQFVRGRLLQPEPPPAEVIVDASAILWATDGKALLGALVEALEKRAAAADPESWHVTRTVLRELRSRLRLNFATAGAWKEWWGGVQELPLEAIFAESVVRTEQEYVANWKNMLKRVKGTGDGRGVLLSIQETLESTAGIELRVAAVSALGEYARWVRDTKLADGAGAGEADAEQAKERLLSDAVATLVSLQKTALERRREGSLESSRVLQAGLSALRPYQVFLESQPALEKEVSALVLAALKRAPLKIAFLSQREYLLESLRLAGVLQVESVRPFLREILRPPEKPWSGDLELLTAAVTTLGVLLDETSSREWIAPMIALLEQPREADGDELREFRRACVNALNGAAETGIKDPQARSSLRVFFQQLLDDLGEKELRIPSIVGLGTLARIGDDEALALLVGVISRPAEFEPAVLLAAIDSIAFVNPQVALERLLPRLAERDQVIHDHLWKRVVYLVQSGGSELLLEALRQFQLMSYQEDSQVVLETAVRLAEQPDFAAFLAPETLDTSDAVQLNFTWAAALQLAQIYDLLGATAKRDVALSRLADHLQRDAKVKEAASKGVEELEAFRRLLARRQAFADSAVEFQAIDPGALATSFGALFVESQPTPWRQGTLQWLYRELAMRPPEDQRRGVEIFHEFLVEQASDGPLWTGLPTKFREGYLARLKSLEGLDKSTDDERPTSDPSRPDAGK